MFLVCLYLHVTDVAGEVDTREAGSALLRVVLRCPVLYREGGVVQRLKRRYVVTLTLQD